MLKNIQLKLSIMLFNVIFKKFTELKSYIHIGAKK